jgi:hypothetical protein
MADGIVHARVDAEDLAKGLALDYVSEKMVGTNLGAGRGPSDAPAYVVKTSAYPTGSGFGKSVYRAEPSETESAEIEVMPARKGGGGGLRAILKIRRRAAKSPAPVTKAVRIVKTSKHHPKTTQVRVYRNAVAGKAKVGQAYEPIGKAPITPAWPVRQRYTRDDLYEVLDAYNQAQAKSIPSAATETGEEDHWPDECLSHPPLKNVRRVQVRLTDIGQLQPRIAYDPDRE